MIGGYTEEFENREAAIKLLSSLKERRKNVKLRGIEIERNTILYIEDNEHVSNKLQRFIERLKKGRAFSFRNG